MASDDGAPFEVVENMVKLRNLDEANIAVRVSPGRNPLRLRACRQVAT